jgi:hypothetical protein
LFEILDGRENFYQWDLNRKIKVNDNTVTEVHFCNKTDDCSLVTEVYELDGNRVADVPNILLQTSWNVKVYAYCKDYTKIEKVFKVNARTKPTDYVYTETELYTVSKIVEVALIEAKNNGDFKGDKGDKGDAGAIEFIAVTELPTTNIKNAIYLLPTQNEDEQNIFLEYVYINGAWEKIGSAGVEVNLDEYLKKNSEANDVERLYGIDTNGNQKIFGVANTFGAHAIPKCDASGRISSASPTQSYNVATKGYVDDNFLQKINNTNVFNRVYGIKADGSQTVYNVANIQASHIIVMSDAYGCIKAAEPKADNDVTTKRYVNNLITGLEARIAALEGGNV